MTDGKGISEVVRAGAIPVFDVRVQGLRSISRREVRTIPVYNREETPRGALLPVVRWASDLRPPRARGAKKQRKETAGKMGESFRLRVGVFSPNLFVLLCGRLHFLTVAADACSQ